jgi:hypothetical protein
MPRRFRSHSTPIENLRIVMRAIPWRFLLALTILVLSAIPAYMLGERIGAHVIPNVTNFFVDLGAPPPSATPTPLPPFITALPQPGSLLYTVQQGDNCDEILVFQMHMADAGQIFSDVKPNTVKALGAAVGVDCHKLQPGMVLALSPQYPLVALGGVVLKVAATSPQQVLPTPLVPVPQQPVLGIDCSDGCRLTVRIAPGVDVQLLVQTTIPVRVGSWVWAQAAYARQVVPGFSNYPYADPNASLNGMVLQACDLQIDNTHDNNSLSCDQLQPNTIDDDGGAWLLGVTGPGGLDHWRYPLHFAPGTRLLIWLTVDNNGNLKFQKGNPVYRYDENTGLYVRA